jgi:hypothetical protein
MCPRGPEGVEEWCPSGLFAPKRFAQPGRSGGRDTPHGRGRLFWPCFGGAFFLCRGVYGHSPPKPHREPHAIGIAGLQWIACPQGVQGAPSGNRQLIGEGPRLRTCRRLKISIDKPRYAIAPAVVRCNRPNAALPSPAMNSRRHSTTSSARTSSAVGKVMPSAFAALRLSDSRTFVDC